MTLSPWLIYAPAALVVSLGTRAWVSYRANIRKRREASLPLVDPFLLEVVFSPRKANPDDDEGVLDEMKRIVARFNTRSRLLEFETSGSKLVRFYGTLSIISRPCARRAVIRMLRSGDDHLRALGSEIAASLNLPEASDSSAG